GLRAGPRAVPAPVRAAQPARRHAVRRRAADGRDGPRADVTPAAAADGRAVDGPVARARPAELPDHQEDPLVRRRRADGRADRGDGAVDRRRRLRPVYWGDRARGPSVGAVAQLGPEAGIPGTMREAHEPWPTALLSPPSLTPARDGMGWSGGWWSCRRGHGSRARPGRAASSGS